MNTVSDFTVDTKGHCFFCLKKSLPQFTKNIAQPPGTSLQSLSRYLRINMRKVFDEGCPISLDLLSKVDNSRLKATLCAECSELNKKISGLLRQLDKIKMEVGFHINLLQEKLLEEQSEEAFNIPGQLNGCSSEEWVGKWKIAKALRTDALQNCARKLTSNSSSPRIHLKKLTEEEVKKNQSASKTQPSTLNDLRSIVKVESEGQPGWGIGVDEMSREYPTADTMLEDAWQDNNDMDFGKEEPNTLDTTTTTSLMVPPPMTLSSKESEGIPEIPANPETGSYKCPVCSKELSSQKIFRQHYLNVHLKVKYKCLVCDKEFSGKGNYNKHYMNLHMGVKFKCPH